MSAMRALAGLVVKGPWQAGLVIVLATALAMAAPPLTSVLIYAGGGALALYTLYAGAAESLLTLAGSLAFVGGLLLAAGGQAAPAGLLLLYWLPVWLSAVVLRYTVSLSAALLALTAIGLLLVVLAFAWLGDPAAWWQQQLQPLVEQLASQAELGLDRGELQTAAARTARLMTGLMSAGLVFAALFSLLLGRWWQSLLVNPGGLGKEFLALALGRGPTLAAAALLGLASLDLGVAADFATQLALVVLVPLVLVGLAAIHASLVARGVGRGWLVGLYLVVGLLPQALLLVAVVGLLDPWLDLRHRSGARG